MGATGTDRCAYCGGVVTKGSDKTRDHVFPENLYPVARRITYSPITVPACEGCNSSWSDDEEHFRNVVNAAGAFNQAARELYLDKIQRSLRRPAGNRRILDLQSISEVAKAHDSTQLKIFPARDARVLNVIRKIVVGLCHYHGITIALSTKRIWVDILQPFWVPDEYLARLTHEHCEADIVEYWYGVRTEQGLHSVWVFRFYERTPFIAVVSEAKDGSFPWEASA